MRKFIDTHYKHFNARALKASASGWLSHEKSGGKMLLAMGGAMSTAEIGISLAEMIRRDKIHAISTTGANLEEDLFNLVAHKSYKQIPEYRSLSIQEEEKLFQEGLNRITDTCIPEEEAMRRIETHLLELWQKAGEEKKSYFPYEYMYQLIQSGKLGESYEIDPKDSWVVAACEKNLPIYTPGWEDSTLGNMFVGNIIKKKLTSSRIIKDGLEQMKHLVGWYQTLATKHSVGFFQIGGGIAGDFAICVVPLLTQDLKEKISRWGYFCQVTDSMTSYGSYSGASPNEKITWGKLSPETPKFVIESDATIVVPLIFNYVLGK